MTAQEILKTKDFKKCIEFHGHLCPGLSMGYRASKAGMERLNENKRSVDEEIVVITETDACGADAIQVLTGCTFGKGNFIYKDYGKTAFTFFSRKTGKGVRVALIHNALAMTDKHLQLINRIVNDIADAEDRKEFQTIHFEKSLEILEKPINELFTIKDVSIPIPNKARIEKSQACKLCKEPVMPSKLNENQICRACQELA
ncbi:formylmethanofuran dehydrogenase subunit E [Candidatus Magnetomorum sp. HK-1]|nr:formylmethanofuran dehydrogenase subunit E [Candidatus Magnetomorum sp. HK-1]